jgi:hypothetical protein
MTDIWLSSLEKVDKGQRLKRTETDDPKGCLHTTETSGKPSYNGWSVNPHIDVTPIPNVGVTGRQFIPLNYASFALRHTEAQATNTDDVVQIELIGTCSSTGPGYYWPDADDAVLKDLYTKVIKPCSDALGIPIRALEFASRDLATRLTNNQFDVYSGWLGHEHVPQNTHWDPGKFPWNRMMQIQLAKPKPLTSVGGQMLVLVGTRVFDISAGLADYVESPQVVNAYIKTLNNPNIKTSANLPKVDETVLAAYLRTDDLKAAVRLILTPGASTVAPLTPSDIRAAVSAVMNAATYPNI